MVLSQFRSQGCEAGAMRIWQWRGDGATRRWGRKGKGIRFFQARAGIFLYDDGDLKEMLECGGRAGASGKGGIEMAEVEGIWHPVGFARRIDANTKPSEQMGGGMVPPGHPAVSAAMSDTEASGCPRGMRGGGVANGADEFEQLFRHQGAVRDDAFPMNGKRPAAAYV